MAVVFRVWVLRFRSLGSWFKVYKGLVFKAGVKGSHVAANVLHSREEEACLNEKGV